MWQSNGESENMRMNYIVSMHTWCAENNDHRTYPQLEPTSTEIVVPDSRPQNYEATTRTGSGED